MRSHREEIFNVHCYGKGYTKIIKHTKVPQPENAKSLLTLFSQPRKVLDPIRIEFWDGKKARYLNGSMDSIRVDAILFCFDPADFHSFVRAQSFVEYEVMGLKKPVILVSTGEGCEESDSLELAVSKYAADNRVDFFKLREVISNNSRFYEQLGKWARAKALDRTDMEMASHKPR